MYISRGEERAGQNLLGELKRNRMPYMHTVAAWTSSGIQIERDTLLIFVQYKIEVSVAEDKPSTEHSMGFMTSDLLEALQKRLVDPLGPKISCELFIIDRFRFPLFIETAGDFKGGNRLFFRFSLLRSFCESQ